MNSIPPAAYVRLSVVERDRRWAALRHRMERARIDCVITPNHTGHNGTLQADSRYLTCCTAYEGDVACVFPLAGEVTAIVAAHEHEREMQEWVPDVRPAAGPFGAAAAARLREIPLPHKRVGLVGLADTNGARDGTMPHGFVAALREAFPRVQWVDFTATLRDLRMTKSEEEIVLLARSAAMVDRAFARVQEVARPGVLDYQAWGATMGELCRAGSEMPVYSAWGSGIRPTLLPRPTHGELQRGYVLVSELEAAYGGYRARGVQAFAIEDCDPLWKDLYARHADYWQACFDLLRVGRTVGEVADACAEMATRAKPEGGRFEKPSARLMLRGAGLGSDGPVATSRRAEQTSTEVFAPGWVFAFRPTLRAEVSGRPYVATWGDTVLMTAEGPRQLGTRRPGLAIAQG